MACSTRSCQRGDRTFAAADWCVPLDEDEPSGDGDGDDSDDGGEAVGAVSVADGFGFSVAGRDGFPASAGGVGFCGDAFWGGVFCEGFSGEASCFGAVGPVERSSVTEGSGRSETDRATGGAVAAGFGEACWCRSSPSPALSPLAPPAAAWSIRAASWSHRARSAALSFSRWSP